MSSKRFTALIAATSCVAGCTAPPATHSAPVTAHRSAQLGTVDPACPTGTDLTPGVEVMEAIPVVDLSPTEPFPLDATDLCGSVPADVVTPAGFAATPEFGDSVGCVWHGSGLSLDIGATPYSMAKEVEQHRAMAAGGTTDPLAHLAWLRVDGHYAIERILQFDRTKGCWLSLDVSSPATVHAIVYRIDPATDEPVASDTNTSVREACPIAREVAKNLLNHLDGERPGWWETDVQPTG